MKKYLIVNMLMLSVLFISFVKKQVTRKIMADRNTSSATYSMKHPMHDWDGVSKKVSAVIVYADASKTVTQAAVSIPVASFDSDNSNRDSHAIEVLEGLKYPNVSFKSSDVKIEAGKFVANGVLTFHGVSKNVKAEGDVKTTDKSIALIGNFDVSLTDFNIQRPSLMGIKTEDLMKIKFNIGFNLK